MPRPTVIWYPIMSPAYPHPGEARHEKLVSTLGQKKTDTISRHQDMILCLEIVGDYFSFIVCSILLRSLGEGILSDGRIVINDAGSVEPAYVDVLSSAASWLYTQIALCQSCKPSEPSWSSPVILVDE